MTDPAPLLPEPLRRYGKKAVAALFLGFVLLCVARFAYSFAVPADELNRFRESWVSQVREFESISYKRSAMTNIAQLGMTVEQVLAQGNVARLQVFEKTGQVSSGTPAFEDDARKLFDLVAAQKGQIKYEKHEGLAPARTLTLALSVNSEAFDETMKRLKGIGELQTASITKRDMTDTFRTLFAKREALSQYQEALAKLRQAQGRVEEFLKLEEKILAMQEEIRSQSIQLGDFTQKESFCNIACALVEKGKAAPYTLQTRAADAVFWSVEKSFFGGLAGIAAFLVVLSVRWLRE